MSNQFYDYLSNKLIDFFRNNSLNPGERFFINFDNKEQVTNFYNSLKKNATGTFEYEKSDEFSSFKTFSINFGKVDLVVADSSVTSDFLVTLRNEVSKSEGIWKNKALLIVSDGIKDSINEGMINLQDEGYPFSLNYISNNLSNDIQKSDLSPQDCDILNVFLEGSNDKTLYENTLWDFEEVLSIINKGKIDSSDYKGLDMFYDSGLDTISNSTSRRNRIKNNNELFLKIDDIANFEEYESKLEKMFDSKGISELTQNENQWYGADYNTLLTSQNKFASKNGKLKYLGSIINEDLEYWEKPLKDTVAGRRKREIIIFNKNNLDEVSISFSFDKQLNRNFLNNSSSKNDGSISGSQLIFKIPCNKNEPTFKRYIYEHELLTKNNFEFNICVLPTESRLISSIESIFNINIRSKKIQINQDQGFLKFGEGDFSEVVISEDNSEFIISETDSVEINIEDSLLEESIDFTLINDNVSIPFMIKKLSQKNVPLRPVQVWDKKRINNFDFIFEDSKLKQGDNVYNISTDQFKQILNIEKLIIDNKVIWGKFDKDNLIKKDIDIPDTLKNCYEDIFNFYSYKDNIPSLVHLDDELKGLYKKLLYYFNQEIESIPENMTIATSDKKDLLKLGVVEYGDKIMFSSLSPLNIAFQLEVFNQCGNEEINSNIIDSLTPNNLLPYIYVEDKLYRPVTQNSYNGLKEWIVYEESNEVSIGTTNIFIKKVVNEKLKQFVSHFKYLFKDNSNAPLIINIINIDNDIEVVKGVVEFIRDRLPDKRKTGGVIPIEAHIYNESNDTYFNKLFECKNEDDFKEIFGMDFGSSGIDSSDILRLVQENIKYYYYNSLDNEKYNYAHISFYKSVSSSQTSSSSMEDLETGLSLNGVISVVTSNPPEDNKIANHKNYRTGFGVKHADLENDLPKFAKNINELAFNNQNYGLNPYRKGYSIVSMPDMINEDLMNSLYDKSHWVTFIEPNFGLDYFSDNAELFIIHYSDQYSSSAKYDTITVTNKSNQYMQIIDIQKDTYFNK